MIFQNETFLANEKKSKTFWHGSDTQNWQISRQRKILTQNKNKTQLDTLGKISTCFWHKVNFNLWFRKLVRGFSERVSISFLLDRAGKKKMRKPILELGYSTHADKTDTHPDVKLVKRSKFKILPNMTIINIQPKKMTAFSHKKNHWLKWKKKLKTKRSKQNMRLERMEKTKKRKKLGHRFAHYWCELCG